LKTPLRGKIPLDEYGRFSLNLTGDASFEESKAAAKAELESENRNRKDSSATSRRNAEALGVKPIRISDFADENARRRKYGLVIGSEGYKYNKSVYDILAHFAKWNASRPKKRNRKKYNLITDIDNELVREYYAEISQRQSWQTFRKYVFILKSVFRDLTYGAIPNPFQIQYSDYKSKKSEFGDKEEIAHKPPSAEQMRKAVTMFKDSYMLDFINVEEIGLRDGIDVDERVVEKEIINKIKNFIMTIGRDFTFMGNQQLLEVYGVEHFPDLLFFNRELNAMVVIELKTGEFKTSYLGQLMGYLTILDEKVRKPHENPSIGIVLCKSANREYVEFMIRDYSKPMGVATYKTSDEMPEHLRKALPSKEEFAKLMEKEDEA